MANKLLAGSCLCGAVRYEVEDAFVYAANCHCSSCRRATGSAYKPFGGIEIDKFRRISDDVDVLIWGDPANGHDVRCRHCGSLCYSVVRENLWIHVAMGTLLDEPSIKPNEHIFVGSKAAWEVILDDLPQYEGHAVGQPLNR